MEQSKILVVDDELFNIRLYLEMLKNTGYSIISATNGIDAVKYTFNECPDLIILDWNMPGQNGLETLKILKKDEITKEIPVIMITGIMTTSENLETAFAEGAVDFLRKPFEKTELLARVRSSRLLSGAMKSLKEKFVQIENNHRLIQSLVNCISHPLVYYTLDGIILGYNNQFIELLGADHGDLKGKLIYRICYNSNSTLHLTSDLELIKSQGEKKYECKINDNNVFLFSKVLFYDTAGLPQGILCVMTNITSIKKNHAELMETKKKELVSGALKLIQINQVNNQLIDELGKLNAFTNKEGSENIRRIIRQYNVSASEGIWKDFETRFGQVYDGFYKQLMEQFPDLTPGERKLCALLRLNFTSKNIASITFQNPHSVDIARSRLRKKLNLGSDANLVDFLLKIETN